MNTDELIKKQTNWIKAVFGALAAIVAALVAGIACFYLGIVACI